MKIVFLSLYIVLFGLSLELSAMRQESSFSHDPEERERVRRAYEYGLESARKEVRDFLQKIESEKKDN